MDADDTDAVYTVFIHIGTYWFLAMMFLILDTYWARRGITKYKVGGLSRPFAPTKKIGSALLLSVVNQAISVPLIYYVTPHCITQASRSVHLLHPMVLLQLLFYVVSTDCWFYWVHRLMHMNKTLFRHVHYLHHEWVYPMAIRTIYTHPVEHLLGNVGSIVIGPYLWPGSRGLIYLWVIGATASSVFAHCGTILPFFSSVTHDLHHRYLTCNYGVLSISDRLYGTLRRENL